MSQRRTWFYILVVLPMVGMMTIGALAYSKLLMPLYGGRLLPKDGKVLPSPGSVAFQPHQHRMNILVLGIDYNHDRRGMIYTKGARSDTMMVVSLNRKGEFLNVVSIPRDTYVQISQELGYERINAAYSYGGARQAIRTVGRFLGVPIHHYVSIKVSGATTVLDALGGITLDVEKKMDYDDHWGNLHIHLKKGRQTLTGQQAVGYARFRMDEEGDRGRMRRQQQVIRALVAKLKSPSTVARIPALARAVKQTLETDLSLAEMIDLAHLYKSFDPKRVCAAQVVGNDETIGGAWVIVPCEPENRRIVRRLLKDASVPPTFTRGAGPSRAQS